MAFSLDVEPASFIYLDLFPADVRPGGQSEASIGEELRVIATDNYLYVLEDTIDGPDFAVKEPLTLFEGSNKDGYMVTTASGDVFWVIRAANCGCGSRLRGLHPFAGVPYQARLQRK